jgi:hypothetical protein
MDETTTTLQPTDFHRQQNPNSNIISGFCQNKLAMVTFLCQTYIYMFAELMHNLANKNIILGYIGTVYPQYNNVTDDYRQTTDGHTIITATDRSLPLSRSAKEASIDSLFGK